MNDRRHCHWTGGRSASFAKVIPGESGHGCIWRLAGFAICNAPTQTCIIRRWFGRCWHGSYSAHQNRPWMLKGWVIALRSHCPMRLIWSGHVQHRQLCGHAHEAAAHAHLPVIQEIDQN